MGLLRLTPDLTRRRLNIFAEIGAVEVVKGAAAPPKPGTDSRRRAAVREAVYALRQRGLVRAGGGGGQLDRILLKNYRVDCRLSVLKTLHHVRGLAAEVDDPRLNPP